MYQPSTNFFGKDNFRWWIGQVTDPDKGEWKECLEKTQAENEEDALKKAQNIGDCFGGSDYPKQYNPKCVHRDVFTTDAMEVSNG